MPSSKPPIPPVPPGPPSTPSSPSSSDTDSVARPSLYIHEPIARPAPLEEFYDERRHELLSELKSDRLEGIYNLSFLLLAFSLLYLSVRNIVETGFLAGPSAICPQRLIRDCGVSVLLLIPIPLFFSISYIIMRMFVNRSMSAYTTVLLHALFLVALFTCSTLALFHAKLNPMFGICHGLIHVVISLKTHSYIFTNLLLHEETALRKARRRVQASLPPRGANSTASVSSLDSRRTATVVYPRNITVWNYVYFIVAPTLVYETSYPRTCEIRKAYVVRYLGQATFCLVVQYILIMQFCVPVWKKCDNNMWWFCMMKLALPCFVCWLLMFWGFFHCSLLMIAELTHFADRQFYREWWNATTLHQFWRWWNTLVHEWCLRHLYVESVSRHKVQRGTAAMGTFLMSAFLHEYVAFVGFRMLRPYIFFGMMAQMPLIQMSVRWEGRREGNFVMWIMLFVGQCSMSLLYFRDYVAANGSLMCGD